MPCLTGARSASFLCRKKYLCRLKSTDPHIHMKRILLFILLLPSLYLAAQDTIGGSLSAGGQVLSGNFKMYTLNFGAEVRGHRLRHDWAVSPLFRYTYNTGVLKEREAYSTEAYFYRFAPACEVSGILRAGALLAAQNALSRQSGCGPEL